MSSVRLCTEIALSPLSQHNWEYVTYFVFFPVTLERWLPFQVISLRKWNKLTANQNLISTSNFAGQSYLRIRSSVYTILIWDPCIFNLDGFCQTRSNCMRRKSHQCALHLNKQMTRAHLLSYSLVSGQFELILFYCRKARPLEHRIDCHPFERSRQNHLVCTIYLLTGYPVRTEKY